MKTDYEVLIIGGGPAGLSAALSLGRIARSALVCDDARPRNAPSSHVNNFPTRDGVHPAEWRLAARNDLGKYQTIELFEGRVDSVEKSGPFFFATLASGRQIITKKVILADGVKDRLLPVPDFAELWGKSIFHCPFCHGFEIRGSRIGILAQSELAFHSLPMIHSLAADLVVFTHGMKLFTQDQREFLARKGISLMEEKIEGFVREGERLRSVVLSSGRSLERQYLFYSPPMPFELKSGIGLSLGCETDSFGLYKVEMRGKTNVPGVFAAGDNMSPGHSVLLASAAGSMAGMGAISELLMEA